MSWFQWKLKRLHIPYQKRRVRFGSTQLDGPGMVSSENVPEILTEDRVCDTVMPEASFTELLMDVEEASLIREESNRTSNDAGAVLDQEFAFRFADPASILDTQGSAGSDQGAQGTGSTPSSSVLVQNITTAADHWTLRSTSLVNHSEDVHEGGVQPPNVSHSRSTVNASASTSLSNNAMGQSPRLHVPSFNDICDHELEKLSREQGTLKKTFEETTSELMAELERKMAEARSEYDKKYQEVDAAYNAQAKKNEALRSLVAMNSLLANAYKSTCPVKSAATDTSTVRARSSQHSTHTHVNSTAPPRPSVTAAEATPPNLLTARSSQHSTTPQQQAVQTNTHMNSTAPPRPSVTAAEATPPNLSAARSFQHSTTHQQQAVQTNTHMNSTAPPRPSVTAAAATPANLSAPLPRCNTPQPRPISQQAAVESNTQMHSTALPRPSVTVEARPSHKPHSNTPQPRPIPQQALVQANTDINSTALPQPSVTEEAPPLHQPSSKTPQPKPISQLPEIQSNTDINSTPLPQPSVTSKAISLHSPPRNTPQPRPPPLISNHTPTSYQAASAPPVHGIVRRTMAPHLRSSRAPNSAAAPSTYPRLVQGQQQQQENSNSGLVYLSDDD
ncbi:hypothetical protein ISN44_As09g011680 [Arabidopsis suecica]|uniref:Uncharacterized protein n=1 Tax=Arabidopsis suecica TaxID=45249 RepID=A0A8T2AH18_ARASU|nr:hypothetical protein ISN44_As09g011680 [Arabidopsis suecica]